MRFWLSLFLFFSSCAFTFAQEKTGIYFHLDHELVKHTIYYDSLKIQRLKLNAIVEFQLLGYHGIELKDSSWKQSNLHYYFIAEGKFNRIILKETSSNKKEKHKSSKTIRQSVIQLNKRITELENKGFPFAKIEIERWEENRESIEMEYKVDSGHFVYLSAIHIKSSDPIHLSSLISLIGIQKGDPYSEKKIRDIPSILELNGCYQLLQPPQIIFHEGNAELFLFVQKNKSSNADGYIGFQQDPTTNKISLNGYINLSLNNAFNRFEELELNWRSNPDKTQYFKGNFNYPFLFKTPFGVSGGTQVQKQDTTFLKSQFLAEITFTDHHFKVRGFNEFESSFLLTSSPTSNYRNYQKNTLGAKFKWTPTIPSIPYLRPEFYGLLGWFNYRNDTLDDNQKKLNNKKFELSYGETLRLGRYFSFFSKISLQGLTSTITLSQNEMIYFGGLRSVRGFYELELFGKEIWIVTNELIFQPVEVLSLKLLHDYSNFYNSEHHYTHSVGVGFGFKTQNSVLELIVANGKLKENPMLISNTKVHIGFKSNF